MKPVDNANNTNKGHVNSKHVTQPAMRVSYPLPPFSGVNQYSVHTTLIAGQLTDTVDTLLSDLSSNLQRLHSVNDDEFSDWHQRR